MNKTVDSKTNKLLGLEVLRFLSAFAVILSHYHVFFGLDSTGNYQSSSLPFYSILGIFFDHGEWGVPFFWCISGYIFFWKYRDLINKGVISWREFFILRFSRLYPLHLVTLMIMLIIINVNAYIPDNFIPDMQHNNLFNLFLQIFMASNWGIEKSSLFSDEMILSFNRPIWSISVEILVYIFFFASLRLGARSIWFNIFLIIFAKILISSQLHYLIWQCILYFYLGGIAAIISEKNKNMKDAVWLTGSIVLLSPVFILYYHLIPDDLFINFYIATTIFYFANVQFYPMFANSIKISGSLTYSSYLIHYPLQLMISATFSSFGYDVPLNEHVFFIIYVITIMYLSYLTYHNLEMPAQNYIRKKYLSHAI